jgi:hypothetical protein
MIFSCQGIPFILVLESRMPRPKVSRYMTTSNVAKELNMSNGSVRNWIDHGALPEATYIDENSVRYFDAEWLEEAKEIVNRKVKV